MSKNYIFKGKVFWFRALADQAHDGYEEGDAPLWDFDLSLDEEGVQAWKKLGVRKAVKNKGDLRGDFVTLSRKAVKVDGTPAKPIDVYGPDLKPWPQDKKIGNGSVCNVKLIINEREFKGKKMLVPSVFEIQVWEHVEYEAPSNFTVKTGESTGTNW